MCSQNKATDGATHAGRTIENHSEHLGDQFGPLAKQLGWLRSHPGTLRNGRGRYQEQLVRGRGHHPYVPTPSNNT